MYMINPTTAAELSRESGSGTSWIVGGSSFENLARDDVNHEPLDAAPPVAQEIARRLHDALGSAILPGSKSDSMGRVIVIDSLPFPWEEGQRLPEKRLLINALGLKDTVDGKNLLEEVTLAEKDDFSSPGRMYWLGYTFEDDEEYIEENTGGETLGDVDKARQASELMASDLEKHLVLNFSEEIVCAPVLYGGRASDGNIVAILSMRVWT